MVYIIAYVIIVSGHSVTACVEQHTFCWQGEPWSVQTRHLESNTNTDVCSLNVTLLLDTDTNHVMLVQ